MLWPFRKKKELRYSITDPFYFNNVYYLNNTIDNIVLSAISFYTDPVKELPLNVCDGEGKKLNNHRLSSLLIQPSQFYNRSIFFSRLLYNLLMHGQSFAVIRDNDLYLIWEPGAMSAYEFGGQYYYRSKNRVYASEDILHFRSELGDYTQGQSKTKTMNEVITALKTKTLEQVQHGFNTKAFLYGLPANKQSSQAKAFQSDLSDFVRDNSGFKVLSMGGGQELKKLDIDYKTESFVIFKKLLRREIYNLFGISQTLASDSDRPASTYKTMTEALAVFIRLHLSPTLSIFESELSEKLLTQNELINGYSIKFNFENLLRGDSETIYKNFSLASGQQAFLTPNEIRKKLGLSAVIGGDMLGGNNEN